MKSEFDKLDNLKQTFVSWLISNAIDQEFYKSVEYSSRKEIIDLIINVINSENIYKLRDSDTQLVKDIFKRKRNMESPFLESSFMTFPFGPALKIDIIAHYIVGIESKFNKMK